MDMSYAQALNEAQQVIVQQSNRIKSDADKIRQQQQTIVDQCSQITEHESKSREQAAEIARQTESVEALEVQLSKLTVAREQAEAVIDRQGQRLSSVQEQVKTLEQTVTEQSETIGQLTAERDRFQAQVPSQADAEALSAMAALLTTKKASRPARDGAQSKGSLRLSNAPLAEAA